MVKTFYIFRHGQTDLNAQQRWQGSGMDYDVNEVGLAQAHDLAEKLKDKNLEIIYSSPLIRAKHTAEVVAELSQIKVEVRPNLRECFYGEFEGASMPEKMKTHAELIKKWSAGLKENWDLHFAGGESRRQTQQRVWAEIEKIAKTSDYKVIGIAIHGGTMDTLLRYLDFEFDKIPNCAVFRLDFDEDTDRAQVVGDIF